MTHGRAGHLGAIEIVSGALFCIGQVSLSFEGHLDGWCCYPDHLQDRATVEVLLDGKCFRATMAARLRPDLRDIGMGDGYYGFVIPIPPNTRQDGRSSTIEVRDRRSGQVIGRIRLGAHDVDWKKRDRLTRAAATFDSAARAIAILASGRERSLVDHFGELGRLLTSRGRQRRLGRGWQQDPGLAIHHAEVAELPWADLGWSIAPRVSVILLGSCDISHQAASLRAAAIALAPLGAEFILVDNGATPLTALLPTRLRHLRLLWAPGEEPGHALNDAALMARGDWLAFAQPNELSGGLLADALSAAAEGHIYAEGPLTSTSSEGRGATVAEDGSDVTVDRGLDCLIARDAFIGIGGLDPSLTPSEIWLDLVEKARVLDHKIVIWQAPRPMRPLAATERLSMRGVAGS